MIFGKLKNSYYILLVWLEEGDKREYSFSLYILYHTNTYSFQYSSDTDTDRVV